MSLEIFDCEQRSDEWFELRSGIPTASHFSDVMARGRGGPYSAVRDEYMRKLAGERLTGVRRESYRNAAMERGEVMEPELRDRYAMIRGVEVHRIGFARRTDPVAGVYGCSPDSLVGSDGCVEYKSCAPHVLIEHMKRGVAPPEHLPQCQGTMMTLDRAWCDLALGYTDAAPGFPGMPLFIRRVRRDENYIAALRLGVEVFNQELDAMTRWLREWRV